MAITLNGTSGITTPDITSEDGLTVTGVGTITGNADQQYNLRVQYATTGFGVYQDDTTGYTRISAYDTSGTTYGKGLTFATATAGSATTERMRIDSYGHVTKPYQPAFFAYGTDTAVNSGTDTKLTFDTEQFDIGSNYSTSTNRFTAPVSGVYFIKAAVRLGGTSGVNEMRLDMSFTVNGSQRAGEGINQQNSNDSGVSSAVIMSLSANDYVEVWVNHNSGTLGTSKSTLNLSIGGTETGTHFCGYLIG